MAEQEFNPIDPYQLPDDQMQAYFERYSELRWREELVTPNVYRGSARFLELVQSGELGLGAVVRVNIFSGLLKDPHYLVTPHGLQDVVHDAGLKTPKEALDTPDMDSIPFWELSDHGFYIEDPSPSI